MKRSIYIYNEGQLRRKDNTICYISDVSGKKDLPIETISDIYVMNELSLNSSLLNILSQYGICIHFFNYYDYYIGSFYPKEQLLAGSLLVKQVEHYLNEKQRLVIAKKIILAASANIYRNLRYYNGRGKDVLSSMNEIQNLRRRIDKCASIPELMGVEGNIRKEYYYAWNVIIDRFTFEKRIMHPPDNEINSLISYLNSIVYTIVLSQIYQTGLNPTISYLHEPGVRRFSLSLDMAEIFKPIIGDRIIFSLLNRGQITSKSFTPELNFLHLRKESSKIILAEVDKTLDRTVKHKELNKVVTYRYLIKLEIYKLIKHLMGEKEYKGFEMWW